MLPLLFDVVVMLTKQLVAFVTLEACGSGYTGVGLDSFVRARRD